MTDSHVHLGWYVDRYHALDVVTVALRDAGIDTIAVSSTSTCAEEYEFVISEMLWLQEEWGENVFPLFWITPGMLNSGCVDILWDADIKWKGLKMHWHANPEFYHDPSLMKQLMKDNRFAELPILLHTGEFPVCHAAVFEQNLTNYPERTFILAHGRPIGETEKLIEAYQNAYVDTAFMAVNDIVRLVNQGLSDKILWGSDCPINEHVYPQFVTSEYLKQSLKALSEQVSEGDFIKITDTNFKKVYNS